MLVATLAAALWVCAPATGFAQAAGKDCPTDALCGVQWDALGGGIVAGGHRFQLQIDAWGQQALLATYLYGVSKTMAVGFTTGNAFMDGQSHPYALQIGIPILMGLVNNGSVSERLLVTPGFYHSAAPVFSPVVGQDNYMNAFWLRVEWNLGWWLRKNQLLLGPAIQAMISMGSPAVGPQSGRFIARGPVMGGMFGEFHVTPAIAITAEVLAGIYISNLPQEPIDIRTLALAYRALLGIAFQTN